MPEDDQARDEAPEENEDEYACVSRDRLILKKSSNMDRESSKSKKRKRKPVEEKGKAPPPPYVTSTNHPSEMGEPRSKRTPAEIAFQEMQLKMQKKRIAKKASMTHKQRVEKFNEHLDSLTEHFDIPKVSWTK